METVNNNNNNNNKLVGAGVYADNCITTIVYEYCLV
jgi:hypothetical protein